MPRATPRPITLADLMVLVAAVAGGLALRRWAETPLDGKLTRSLTSWSSRDIGPRNWLTYAQLRGPGYVACTVTVALAALRWRSPRPRAQRILAQPGAVACLAVMAALLVGFGLNRIETALHVDDPSNGVYMPKNSYAWGYAVGWAPGAVLGVWAALALTGRWRPERSWLDRSGRCLGVYWLIIEPANTLFYPVLNVVLELPKSWLDRGP